MTFWQSIGDCRSWKLLYCKEKLSTATATVSQHHSMLHKVGHCQWAVVSGKWWGSIDVHRCTVCCFRWENSDTLNLKTSHCAAVILQDNSYSSTERCHTLLSIIQEDQTTEDNFVLADPVISSDLNDHTKQQFHPTSIDLKWPTCSSKSNMQMHSLKGILQKKSKGTVDQKAEHNSFADWDCGGHPMSYLALTSTSSWSSSMRIQKCTRLQSRVTTSIT